MALARTLLLMRDEVDAEVADATLMQALTGTRVALIADAKTLTTHAGQSCFVTAALLMARSGHTVHVLAPDVPLVGLQPPLQPGGIIASLSATGADLLPGITFRTDLPARAFDLAIVLGEAPIEVEALHAIRLNADGWSGHIVPVENAAPFEASLWPLGAMAAGALAAGEAFKVAMRMLASRFRNQARLDTVFGLTDRSTFVLAPAVTPYAADLGALDCVSGGAIVQAALYALARVPGLNGRVRIIEPDTGDITNLNRYMLLTRSRLGRSKAFDLAAALANTNLRVTPVAARFEPQTVDALAPLAPSVLVGVDDIPSRWLVQRQSPAWLGVGATTHWSAMASFHRPGLGCAECLHPTDELGTGAIPTVAFVSFWAGLLTSTFLLRHTAGHALGVAEQQLYMTPFRAENAIRTPVVYRILCPTCRMLRCTVSPKRAIAQSDAAKASAK